MKLDHESDLQIGAFSIVSTSGVAATSHREQNASNHMSAPRLIVPSTAADPVADLAREFHCPGVAGHPVGFQKSACGRDLR
jgi:hypothetical protein